jgi:F0F1-type ATP synthase membrane subunit c/vacuolar-type H+-ATPase subunit K
MTTDLDDVRKSTLDRMERSERHYKLAFLGAAVLEGFFLIGFLLLADIHNRTHMLLLVATIATYTIIALGLVALGAHMNRNTLRILKAMELR